VTQKLTEVVEHVSTQIFSVQRNASEFKISLILSNGYCYKLHVSRALLVKLMVPQLDMTFHTVYEI
jgi:hypothetical protein